jgi:hypothetical protein
MSVPRSVAEVLASHVTQEAEEIDRMYLNGTFRFTAGTRWPAAFVFSGATSSPPAP